MAASTTLPIRRLDSETYGRMARCGALEGEPVELLEGLLVEVSPHGPEHAEVIGRLTRHLKTALYARAHVPTYWLVDVPAREVVVYTDPVDDGYRRRETCRSHELLPSPAEGVPAIDVAAVFAGLPKT